MELETEVLAERAIEMTEPAFNQFSQQLIEVDQHYLDGEFDRQLIKRRILQSKLVIAQHIYFMGRDLLALKEHSEHGEFTRDLNDLGIHERVARRYMTVALKFNTPKMQQLIKGLNSDKGVLTKLLELSAEPDEELEQLVDGGTVAGLELDDIDRMSAKELREALKKARSDHQADRDAHDQVIQQKNQHADDLARDLAKLQGKAPLERYPDIVEQFVRDISDQGFLAESVLANVMKIIFAIGEVELPDDARRLMAHDVIAKVDILAERVGAIQQAIFDEFGQFYDEPRHIMQQPDLPDVSDFVNGDATS